MTGAVKIPNRYRWRSHKGSVRLHLVRIVKYGPIIVLCDSIGRETRKSDWVEVKGDKQAEFEKCKTCLSMASAEYGAGRKNND